MQRNCPKHLSLLLSLAPLSFQFSDSLSHAWNSNLFDPEACGSLAAFVRIHGRFSLQWKPDFLACPKFRDEDFGLWMICAARKRRIIERDVLVSCLKSDCSLEQLFGDPADYFPGCASLEPSST